MPPRSAPGEVPRFLCGFVALVSFGLWFATAWHALPTLAWTSVEGTVVDAIERTETRHGRRGARHEVLVADVNLRYPFGGKEWTSTLTLPLDRPWKEGTPRRVTSVPEYPPGSVVRAYADPDAPHNLETRRGPHPSTWVVLALAIGCGAAWLLMWHTGYGKRRPGRLPPHPAR